MRRFAYVEWEIFPKYHAAIWPEIAAKISECNIRNYSIYQSKTGEIRGI
ncbi:MAG: L-rhamnose mutarotase [Spirochaetales bacterium]|nr:L-rhamnose mutarotase [Spirochaetales bacterium]